MRRTVIVTRRVRTGKGRRDRLLSDRPTCRKVVCRHRVVGVIHRRNGRRVRNHVVGTIQADVPAIIIGGCGSGGIGHVEVVARCAALVDGDAHDVAQDHAGNGKRGAVILAVIGDCPIGKAAAVWMVRRPRCGQRRLLDRPALFGNGARFEFIVSAVRAADGGQGNGVDARVACIEVIRGVCCDGGGLIAERGARDRRGRSVKVDQDRIAADDARDRKAKAVLQAVIRDGSIGE